MKKLILAAVAGLVLVACDDGRNGSETFDDTPPSGKARPAQDVDRQPDKPDGGATGT